MSLWLILTGNTIHETWFLCFCLKQSILHKLDSCRGIKPLPFLLASLRSFNVAKLNQA